MVGQDLLGHLRRAAEDETVLLQLLERQVVTLARLAPALIAFVAPLVAIADAVLRLLAAVGDAEVAEDVEALEGPVVLLQGALVHRHGFAQERLGVTPAGDPVVGDFGHPRHRRHRIGAEQDRRPGLLYRLGFDGDSVDPVVAALVVHLVLRPQPLHHLDALHHPRPLLALGYAHGVELDVAVALADAEKELAAAQVVDGGGVLRHHQGFVHGQQEYRGAEVHARNHAGEIGQQRQGLQHRRVGSRGVVMSDKEGLVVAGLGDPRPFRVVAADVRRILGRRIAAERDTKTHCENLRLCWGYPT